jgi:hypothetical protein
MQLRLAAPVAVLALAGAGVPALATGAPARVEAVSAHQVRGDLGAASGRPTAWAGRALRQQAKRLGVDASTFRWETVRTSLIGTHVRGRQYRGGLPIEGTDVLVSAIAGRVAQVDVDGSGLAGAPATHPVGELVARAAALGHLKVTKVLVPTHTDRVLAPTAGRLADTYQVTVVARSAQARVDVDAATGRVLGVVDPGRHDTGTAHVFDPNPVVTSRNTALRQPAETGGPDVDFPLPSAALTAQLKAVPVTFTPSAGQLTGDWANLVLPVGYIGSDSGGSGDFSFSRSDPRFVGLMAYTHLDRYQRWLQSLGFTNVNAEPQDVIALTVGDDNSAYYPGEDLIVFGGGGVPDAEDAEVVLHEYGHAIQDAQVKGFGATHEGGSMGEGFGDFDAANYYAMTSGGFGDLCVAEWDSTTYSSSTPPCLRRMDSKKHYPQDLDKVNHDVHADGEMWSAFLWRLRSHLGTDARTRSANAIRLVLTSHELETPDATFASGVAALRTAAKALHHSDWARWVDKEAKTTGFPLNP